MKFVATHTTTKEGLMAATAFSAESICREFAAQFDTPNVRQAIALAEAGTLSWEQIEEIFRSSLAEGLEAVK